MPYADPEMRKQWLKDKLAEGYGKKLYRARRQHFANEKVLRAAVSEAVVMFTGVGGLRGGSDAHLADCEAKLTEIEGVLAQALLDAPVVTRQPMEIEHEA